MSKQHLAQKLGHWAQYIGVWKTFVQESLFFRATWEYTPKNLLSWMKQRSRIALGLIEDERSLSSYCFFVRSWIFVIQSE